MAQRSPSGQAGAAVLADGGALSVKLSPQR